MSGFFEMSSPKFKHMNYSGLTFFDNVPCYIAISDISNEDELIIEVKDSGCGIPKEQAHLLFTPFKKLNSSTEGSGLGMSICQNLASKLSGQISYSPNAPQGTIFRLSLPREQPETN